jgi:hypothetical protein
MVQYDVKEKKEKIEVIKLTKTEFKSLNDVYRQAVLKKFGNLNNKEIPNMCKIILTDGFMRTELDVEIV